MKNDGLREMNELLEFLVLAIEDSLRNLQKLLWKKSREMYSGEDGFLETKLWNNRNLKRSKSEN